MTDPGIALAISRLLFYVGAITAYGVSAFSAWLAPGPLGQRLAAASTGAVAGASLVALGATIAWLPLEAATVMGQWDAALDRGTLSVLLGTELSAVWLVRLALAVALAFGGLSRPAVGTRAVLAALLLASLALGGHAAMDEGLARRVLHMLNHAVHLLAGGFWLGSLAILPACLARLREPADCADAATALRRFSRAGHVAVALVIASGIVNTALVLGRWPVDTASAYQLLLAVKILLVLAMTGLALVNRYIFVPRIRSAPDDAIAAIRAGTFAELALGAGMLALVAFFGLLDPAG